MVLVGSGWLAGDIAVVESCQVVKNFFARTQDASDSLPLEVGLFLRWYSLKMDGLELEYRYYKK